MPKNVTRTVRLEDTLDRAIQEKAKEANTSVNFLVNRLIRKYIDWTPFFQTWMLFGRFPEIFKDEKVGTEAKKLYDDANALLDKIVREKWLTAKGVIGFWKANNETSTE